MITRGEHEPPAAIRRSLGRWGLYGSLAWVAWCCLAGLPVRAEVALELRIPAAETYVIGDPIPLFWQFLNRSNQPLAFMWEGCCRLNGKLLVTAADRDLPTAPPGQALAHMFARADRLDPGVAREYDTRVSDWVTLPGTGVYELRGIYRGVLPSQFPQVQRGLALWRDAAQSGPVRLAVLSVADYWGQREERVRRRGLRVTLEGPTRLTPFAPASFRVRFDNLGPEARSVAWPDDVSLWVVDARDRRSVPAAVVAGPTGQLQVPAGGSVEGEFVLGVDRFEGEALRDYRLFVDLREAGPGQPRVPSNVVPFAWRLGVGEVAALVQAAAKGAGTGARNAPLKLLRVHLADLGGMLAEVDRSAREPEAKVLAGRLSRAACLKPLAPAPGSVALALGLPATGEPQWVSSVMRVAVAGIPGGFKPQLAEVLGLRRHLGWEVTLALNPADEIEMARVFSVANAVAPMQSEMGGVPAILLSVETGKGKETNAPARLALVGAAAGTQSGPGSSNAGAEGPRWRIQGAGLWFAAVDRRFEPVTDAEAVEERVGASRSGGRPVRVEVSPSLKWREVREALRPLAVPGTTCELEPVPE